MSTGDGLPTIGRMDPRPPLLGRVPAGVWTAVTWCGVGLLTLLMVVALHAPPRADLGAGPAVALAAAMVLPVGLVRRWPLPVLGLLLADMVLGTVLGLRVWPLLLALVPVVWYVTATRSRRVGVLAGLAGLAANGVLLVGSPAGRVWLAVSVTAIAWVLGNSRRQRREYVEALRAQAAVRATLAERLRIARELHDMVAHSIGVIALQAGMGSRVLDTRPARARTALEVIEATSRETLSGLRRMLGLLRGSTAAEHGLGELDRLVTTTAHAGVGVDVRWRGARRPVATEVELAAYRIIQEAVTNVVRHAGTDSCLVTIDYRDDELAVEVVDDGRGEGQDRSGGHGLAGMRERVDSHGGRFHAGPRPEGGFRVLAELPL